MRRTFFLHAFLIVLASLCCVAVTQAVTTYTENNDLKFNAGSYSSTCLSGTGGNVSIGLDHYGRSEGLTVPDTAQWLASAWKYRQALTLRSNNASVLNDYRVPLTLDTQALIAAGRMCTDGADIRFATSSIAGAGNSLPYAIESGINTGATLIWVKVPQLAANADTPLYFYYGNSGAAAGSSMAQSFFLGDDFTGANGVLPSTNTWNPRSSSGVMSESFRDIQNNALRYRFGSLTAGTTVFYGERSANAYPYSSGRRYHVAVNAQTTGEAACSLVTLCQGNFSSSESADTWLRLTVQHAAAGPRYRIEKKVSGLITLLRDYTAVSAGFHDVEFLLDSANLQVLVDNTVVYSGAHDLSMSSPYLYLEGASSSAQLSDFSFDTAFVSTYSNPEPFRSATGGAQGHYAPSGTFVSGVLDSGSAATRYTAADWQVLLATAAVLEVAARAHDADVTQVAFSTVAKAGDPGVVGRYFQYRLTFTSADPRYTATFSSITAAYVSPPPAPGNFSGTALSVSSLRWTWQDNSAGQYQEDGFAIYDDGSIYKSSAPASAVSLIETGLAPNTRYTRHAAAYNIAGSSSAPDIGVYTLPADPSVTADRTADSWNMQSTTITFSNQAGFGPGGVSSYRYVFITTNTCAAWTGAEPQWNGASLRLCPAQSGSYYLQVKSFNGDGVTGSTGTYGPYLFDEELPQVAGFAPSSAPWTNGEVKAQYSLADTGGSLLAQSRYRWMASSERPLVGWSAWDPSIGGTTNYMLSRTIGAEGQWYLHVEVQDTAGNVGYACGGPYFVDITSPAAGIAINNGDAYALSPNVTLALTCNDTGAGISQVRYRNSGDAWSPWEAVTSTRAWTLSAGDGDKTVECEVRDHAGNSTPAADTVILDSRTSLTADPVTVRASGATAEEAESFSAAATLSYLPTGSAIASRTVAFTFQATPANATTNAVGIASATFAAPAASGTYSYSADFAGDGAFAASGDAAVVTVTSRQTSLAAEDVMTSVNADFTAKAVLNDYTTGTKIAGRTVIFVFDGTTKTAATNGVGVATVTFTAPASTQVSTYTVTFDGDAIYAPRSGTGKVAIGVRLAIMIPYDVATVAGSSFTAKIHLKDAGDSSDVAGKDVSFYFSGSTKTAVTDGVGIASVTFTAAATTGTQHFTAVFDGDEVYDECSGMGAVSVSHRPTTLLPATSVSGYALDPSFVTSAQLIDTASGAGVAGKEITFVFEGSSAAVVTDAAGVSSATFACGGLARSAVCYYSFNGDATYSACDANGAVQINRRPTALTAYDVTDTVFSTFTAKARLQDFNAATGIGGKQITFTFNGSVKTAFTDSLGIASVTYCAAVSSGSYTFSAAADQDGTYAAASDNGNLTVNLRPVSLSAATRWFYTLNPITATANLTDTASGLPVSGRNVSFVFNGIAQSTTTGAGGAANAVYASTPVAGSYSCSADFGGDSVYAAGSSTASITVNRRPTTVVTAVVNVPAGNAFTAWAQLQDAFGRNIAGKNIIFSFRGSSQTVVTDAEGVATAAYDAPAATGSYTYTASFEQDVTYEAASSVQNVTVVRRAVVLEVNPTSVPALNSVFLTAGLYDAGTYEPVTDMPVSFVFQGTTMTALSQYAEPDCLATAGPFTAVAAAGSYGFTASFAGNALYSPQSGSSLVTVELRTTNIVKYDLSVVVNSTMTLRADLKDGITGAGVAGKMVSISFSGSTAMATTDATGMALSTATAPSTTGSYPYSARFGGDTTYDGSEAAGTISVTVRPTSLQVSDVSTSANSTFTVSGILRDSLTGAALATKTLSFVFQSNTKTAATAAGGSASVSYCAPSSSGTLPFSVSFDGDAVYGACSVTRNAVINRRSTVLQAIDTANAVANDTFTVKGILKDFASNAPIQGEQVSFVFSGTTLTAVTDAGGVAQVSYTAPTATGTYTYTSRFSGSSLYYGSNGMALITVLRRPVNLNVPDLPGIPVVSSFTVQAQLTDAGTGLAIATKTITFSFQSQPKAANTNALGISTATYAAPASTGTLGYTASFAGDALYAPGNGSGNIIMVSRVTVVEVTDIPDAQVGLPFMAQARLKDFVTNETIAAKTITFTFAGTSVAAVTNAGGVAFAGFTAPASSGAYTYSAAFAGEGLYAANQSTGDVTVGLRPTIVQVLDASAIAGSTFSVTAMLKDYSSNVIGGKPVTLQFEGQTFAGTTNGSGVVIATFTAPSSVSEYPYSATFAGDAAYKQCQSTASITTTRRPTSVDISDINAVANSSFTITAVLRDYAGIAVAARTLSFSFSSSTKTAATTAVGVGTTTFYAAATSTNTASYTVWFDGDALYAASNATKEVIIGSRLTSLQASNVASAVACDTFTVTAVLKDATLNEPLPGKQVSFVFLNSTRTAVTDGSGVAVSTYTAPSSTGAYTYTATFTADPLYNGSVSQANITVARRPVAIKAFDLTGVPALSSFTASAQLTDAETGVFISSRTITFLFQSTVRVSTTNAVGISSGTYTSPASTGAYTYTATFAGDALYLPGSAAGSVAVVPRQVTIEASDVTNAVVGRNFIIQAELVDYVSSLPVPGKSMKFLFQGTTNTVTTNAIGVATTTFLAPSSTKTYVCTVSFAGDARYAQYSTTANVTVGLRPTDLNVSNVNVIAGSSFTVTATLRDELSVVVATKTISFVFMGSTVTQATNILGVAAATGTFTAPAATGTYTFTAKFAGDTIYQTSTITGNVYVGMHSTTLQAFNVASAVALDTFTVQAALKDSAAGNIAVAGRTVTFVFQGSTRTAITDAAGIAVSTYTAPASTGSYTFTATFVSSGIYTGSSSQGSVTVVRRSVVVNPYDLTDIPAISSFTATVLLTDAGTGVTLSTKTINFTFSPAARSAATNAVGISTVTFFAPSSSGTYTFNASFAGDALYAPGGNNATVTVIRRPTIVQVTDVAGVISSSFTAQAKLIDYYTHETIASKAIDIIFGSTATVMTNGVGIATVTFVAPASSGTYEYSANFKGDTIYSANSGTGTLQVGLRQVTLSLIGASPYAKDPFEANATLLDTLTGEKLAEKQLTFYFGASSAPVNTNSVGVATSTFNAGDSSGTYTYSAVFEGDNMYAAATQQTAVMVNRRPVVLNEGDIDRFTWRWTKQAITPYAELVDGITSAKVASKPISFVFQGSTSTTSTIGSGIATASFPSLLYEGWYPCSAYFEGDATYAPQRKDDATGVWVEARTTKVTFYPVTTTANSVFQAKAQLYDTVGNVVVAGSSLTFCFQGSSITAMTDGSGEATVSYTAPDAIGTYQLRATFYYDQTYEGSTSTGPVVVGLRQTAVVIVENPVTAGVGKIFITKAKLIDGVNSSSVKGKPIVFGFDGSSVTATTDMATGEAFASFTAPMTISSYPFTAAFEGDNMYMASDATGTVNVDLSSTTVTGVEVLSVPAGDAFVAKAWLKIFPDNTPIVDETVHFVFNSTETISGSTVTVTGGMAQTTFTAPLATNTYTYAASFIGNEYFRSSTSTAYAVNVVRRNGRLNAQPVSVYINDRFTAEGILSDEANGNKLEGKKLVFLLHRPLLADVTGEAFTAFETGSATTTFAAPASSGTYSYCASFGGDALYNACSDTVTITVNRRLTLLTAAPLTPVSANTLFVASATLTDIVDSGSPQKVEGQTVMFVFASSTVYATTDSSGVAMATFLAPAAAGDYSYNVTFAGGQVYLPASSLFNTVTVEKRSTVLLGETVNTIVGAPFTVKGTLIDTTPGGGGIKDMTVRFVLQSTATITKTGITNGDGLTTADYTAPTTTGTYTYVACYDGNDTYAACYSNTIDVVVNAGSTTIIISDYVTTIDEDFLVSAVLKSSTTGDAIAGKTLDFNYRGTPLSAETDSEGEATVSFNAGTSSGTYTLNVEFDGDTSYIGSSAFSSVTVNRRPIQLSAPDIRVNAQNVFTATATLTDVLNPARLVAGREVQFTFNSISSTVYTNDGGIATAQFTAPDVSAFYELDVDFYGDATYDQSATTATVSVEKRPVKVELSSATVIAQEVFVATATVTDREKGFALQQKIVRFVLVLDEHSAYTNDLGRSTATFTAPVSSGTCPMTAHFDGDATYDIGQGLANLTVLRRPTAVALEDAVSRAKDVFVTTATLVDVLKGTVIDTVSLPVRVEYSTQTATGSTSAGKAQVAFVAAATSGTYRMDAWYDGNGTYDTCQSSATLTVIRRDTALAMKDMKTILNEVFRATGTLTDAATGTAVGERPLKLVFITTETVKTDTYGVATATFTAAVASSGTYQADVYFAGDGTYNPFTSSATVTVARRPAVLVSTAVTVNALNVFTATATLKDVLNPSQALANREVAFVFNSISSTVYTNAGGVAKAEFTAPESSGTYAMEIRFEGDTLYLDTGTVVNEKVLRRPVTVVLSSATAIAQEVFTATATFTDTEKGYALVQKTVSLVFVSTSTKETDATYGVATATFTASASTGTYIMSARFDGDATYDIGKVSASLTVLCRSVDITVSSVTVMALEVFTATAALRDVNSPATVIADRPVKFVFDGSTETTRTDGYNIATATFTAPSVAGSYSMDLSFEGDAVYMASATAVAVDVVKRPSTLAIGDATVLCDDVLVTTATLTDGMNHAPLDNRDIRFIFNESTHPVTTAAGLASTTYTAPLSSGTYQVDVLFDGNETYLSTAGSATITVLARPSAIAVEDVTVRIGEIFTATATITDANRKIPAKGLPVSFVFDGSTFTALSNDYGVATATYTALSSSGAYQLNAYFSGNATWLPCSSSSTVIILRHVTGITVANVITEMNAVFIASATLTSAVGAVKGSTVTFSFNGSNADALTNETGVATCTFVCNVVSSGSYTLNADFDGDAGYLPAAGEGTVAVALRPCAIAGSTVTVMAMEVFTATATLRDISAPATMIDGRSVKYVFNGSTRTALTDAYSVAAATFTAPALSGTYAVNLSFAGDSVYMASFTVVTVDVVKRPAALAANDGSVLCSDIVVTTATLTDAVSLEPVAGQLVSFVLNGSTHTGTTNAQGIANAMYTAPDSSGTYRMDVLFNGSGAYLVAGTSATMTVLARPSALRIGDMTARINEVFTATATIRDSNKDLPISGLPVNFLFDGSTITALSDPNGVAVATYTALSSSGAYRLDVSFPGNATYLASASSAALVILRRDSGSSMSNMTAAALEVFTATVTVRDAMNLQALSNEPVHFLFEGSTFTVTTDVNGVAIATYTATASSGTCPVWAYFDGNARFLPVAASATLTVLQRPTWCSIASSTATALEIFTASSTLIDVLSGQPVPGRTQYFVFENSTFTATGSAFGVAAATFTAPVTAGLYPIRTTFNGDATYAVASATGIVAVLTRPVNLTAANVMVIAQETYTSTATLKDALTLLPINPGKMLHFTVNGEEKSAVTDTGTGTAAVTYQAPSSSGSYLLDVAFDGDATYTAATAGNTVTVLTRPVTLTAGNVDVRALDVFVATATLIDTLRSMPVADKNVSFVFNGATATVTTGADGSAFASFTAPSASGTYTLTASFNGDLLYSSGTAAGSVLVRARPTTLKGSDRTATGGEPFTLSATLLDKATAAGIAGKSVTFALVVDGVDTAAQTVTTNAIGVATATVVAPMAPDSYYYSVRFPGDYTYCGSTTTIKVRVGMLTTLVANDITVDAKDAFEARAKLTNAYSEGLPDCLIRFAFTASSGSVRTDSAGTSRYTFTAPAASGTYYYNANFDGDTIYAASQASATVTVQQRSTFALLYSAAVLANSSFTVTAELRDKAGTVGGKPVNITFNGSTVITLTDGLTGQAQAQFFASLSSGTYYATVAFTGDATYGASTSSGTIIVQRRPTDLNTNAIADVVVNSSVTLRAELKDRNTNTGVAGKPVLFTFLGSSQTVTTDPGGVATQVFAAPASSGVYQYSAQFAGDARYIESASSSTIVVGKRPTLLMPYNVSSLASTPFTAQAKLVDVTTQQGIAGKDITFVFQGTTVTVTGDAQGVASTAFTAPASTGAFTFSVAYPADGDTTYLPSVSSATVTVGLESTFIIADAPVGCAIGDGLDVKATLSNSYGIRLAGRQVAFTLNGTEVTGVTDAIGVATCTFTAAMVSSTGTWNYTAEFRGDTAYTASGDTMNVVNVRMRETRMVSKYVQTVPSVLFKVEAALYDNVNGSPLCNQPIPNTPVTFRFYNGVSTAVTAGITNALGIATGTFTSPASTGTYWYSAQYAGDTVYRASSDSSTVHVLVNSGQGIATTVKALAVTAYIGEVFTATATLTAPLGDSFIPVPGKAVEFSFFDGLSTHTLLGYSNTVGVATATFTAPAQDGAYQYRAVFMGDLAYAASNDAAPVDDRRHPDTLAAADVAVNMSQDFAVQAVLSDARTAALLDGRPVVFEFFNGTTIISSATVTDAFGVAVATFTAPNMLGSYFYTARLTGDPLYADIVSTGTVLVVSQGEETFLVLDDVLAGTDEIFTATATFTCKGRPVSDRIITFSFDGVTRVATTTAYGIAVTTFTAPSSTGTFTFSASFAGDTAYKGVGCTAALTVIERESLEDPNPVEISCSSTTREITLRWPEVRKKLFLIKGYQIERTTDLRKNWEKVAFIYSTSSVLSYTCPEFHASVMYFRIRVATWDRQESKGVVVLEVPEAADSAAPDLENTNHIYLSDDRVALVSIPLKLMADIYSGGTASTAPLRVIVQQETDDRFLMTYQIRVKDENDRQIDDFTFKGNRHGIKVELSYEGLARRSPSLAQAASQQAAMYWFNEVEWIKLGGINDILSKTCSVYTQKLGRFSLGIAPVSESFAVTKVAPRIFTPEESSTVINRVHFYYENPSNAEVTIRIFDVSGALVRRALDREGDNIMYWDGRDKDGTVVKGGIYIYQIEAGNKIITGTVVVAK